MLFKSACIGKEVINYEPDLEEGVCVTYKDRLVELSNRSQHDNPISISLKSDNQREHMQIKSYKKLINEYMNALSLAHDAILNFDYKENEKDSKRYSSQSPDEITLLDFASDCGYKQVSSEEN